MASADDRVSSDDGADQLSELEKMAAQELQQKIDDGKRALKLQTQLTQLLQKYIDETEQAIRRKIDQVRSSVSKGIERGLVRDNNQKAAGASIVNYYMREDDDDDKVGILLTHDGRSKGKIREDVAEEEEKDLI